MKRAILPSRLSPWGISKTAGSAVSSSGKPSLIKYVEFNITGRCQAGCITCPVVQSYPQEKSFKTAANLAGELELFKSYFARLKKFGLEFVTLYGREPVLWDQEAQEPNKFLKELIRWLSRDLKVKVCLAASGMSLDPGLLQTLWDHQGVLFMKDWGSAGAVKKLIRNPDAYARIRKSWRLVRQVKGRYKKARVIAEFLYTGLNRADLLPFWRRCFENGILPFVEVPVIKGSCAKNFRSLKIRPQQYVKDIYELSLLNLSLRYGLSKSQAKQSDLWQPPYGSVFPSPCDKLTTAQGVFLERNGDLSVCCGVDKDLGNLGDRDIRRKLAANSLLQRVRHTYENLEGACGACDYSRKFRRCYGCRGNAYTYQSSQPGVFGEDRMCFGKIALELAAQGKLTKFMGRKHIQKIMHYFKS